MPTFQQHIDQAKKNLTFLETINQHASAHVDWQVTVCFYTSLHLVNAHLSVYNMQYRKHVDVKDALNPRNVNSIKEGSSLPDAQYLAYMKLQSLSRRSRYLVNEKDGNLGSDQAYLTFDIHLGRALRHLNNLMSYFNTSYKIGLPKVKINCAELTYSDTPFIVKP